MHELDGGRPPTAVTRFDPGALWDRLSSTYWFLPAVVTLVCAALGQTLTIIDRVYGASPWLGWAYGGGADGARSLLSALAGSTVTVVSVTFSVMVVALTVSSQHFGPRLLSSFMRDRASQLVLGTFTGTFAYCLVVLRTVQGDDAATGSGFVPQLAVSGSVVLTLLSVGMLIYYVHHVAMSMQVSEITVRIAGELERSIERIYPDPIGDDSETEERPVAAPAQAVTVPSATSAYVQEIDGANLISLAASNATTVWVLARPGDFIVEGSPLAAVYPVPADMERFGDRLRRAFTTGADRTSRQDVAFAAQQLVEIALRGLSPGVNEPFTAITCIDRLGQCLAKLIGRAVPSPFRSDRAGSLRVVASPHRFNQLLVEVFEPIIVNVSESNGPVLERVMAVLVPLARAAKRPEDRAAVRKLGERIESVARTRFDSKTRARIEHAHGELRAAFGSGRGRFRTVT